MPNQIKRRRGRPAGSTKANLQRAGEQTERFPIETGYPVPILTRGHNVYPLEKLEPGQSFLIPNKPGFGMHAVDRQIKVIHQKRGNTKAFKTALVKDGHNNIIGRRVWRIK